MKTFKMTLRICVVFCYLLLLGIQSVVTFEDCVQVDYCQCAFDSGGGINLNGISTISTTNNTTVFSKEGKSVVVNPCSNVNVNSSMYSNDNETFEIENHCQSGTAVCLVTRKIEMISIARFSDFKFETVNGKRYLVSISNAWKTKIKLVCDRNNDTDELTLLEPVDEDRHIINLVLKSSKACFTWDVIDVRINGWNILLLVVFIIAFIYFAGGMLFNKVMFGASGIELIPHLTFWISLCSLMKNFVLYCMNGCKTRSAYDQI